jgi:acetoin utilization protein AcuB
MLEELLEESTICERWMTGSLIVVAPADSVTHARALLERHRINQLPVVGARGRLLGIVTDRDLRNIEGTPSERGKGAEEAARVEAIMSHPVVTLGCHSTLVNAAEVMRRTRIGAVPIVKGETLVGIVTRSDILDAFVALAHGKTQRQPPLSARS